MRSVPRNSDVPRVCALLIPLGLLTFYAIITAALAFTIGNIECSTWHIVGFLISSLVHLAVALSVAFRLWQNSDYLKAWTMTNVAILIVLSVLVSLDVICVPPWIYYPYVAVIAWCMCCQILCMSIFAPEAFDPEVRLGRPNTMNRASTELSSVTVELVPERTPVCRECFFANADRTDCLICLQPLVVTEVPDKANSQACYLCQSCRYLTHQDCMLVWIKTSQTCPHCRSPVSPDSYVEFVS